MPGLNTSSLPDLIFTVLFFFMIVTHMRHVEPKVHYQVPQGTEVEKLNHKASVIYIYIGRPVSASDGEEFCIQLNNRIATIADIKQFIATEREQMSDEERARMTVSIRADRDVPMGIIADVKQMLQQSFALRISYSATERHD
jgi:biopolymer transport protein ExbD